MKKSLTMMALSLVLAGCGGEHAADTVLPVPTAVAANSNPVIFSAGENIFSDAVDLDTQLVAMETDADIAEKVDTLVDIGSCKESVIDMLLKLGSWEQVTVTESDVSRTHYYIYFANGDGYGSQENSAGICTTNFQL